MRRLSLYLFVLFMMSHSLLGNSRQIRLGLMDGPVDYSHKEINPFAPSSLDPWRVLNDEEFQWKLKVVEANAFDEVKLVEDSIFQTDQTKDFHRKYPEFTSFVHGTSTASVLLDGLDPHQFSFSNFQLLSLNHLRGLEKWLQDFRPEIVVIPLGLKGEDPIDIEFHKNLQKILSLFSNTLFIISAGNSGYDVRKTSFAHLKGDNILKVAATDFEGHIAYFSTWSSNLVEIGAPGILLEVAIPGNRSSKASGTSFAAPLVANRAALIKSKDSSLTPSQLKEILLKSESIELQDLKFAVQQGRFLIPESHHIAPQYNRSDYQPRCRRKLSRFSHIPKESELLPLMDFRNRRYR